MRKTLAAGSAAALATSGLLFAAAPASAADATVSVLHAIPAGSGADVVDVYANGNLLIDNFTPGTLKTVTVPAGTYLLQVSADGQPASAAILTLNQEVPAGANATVAAYLTADAKPAIKTFINSTKMSPSGQGNLTVRHIAAAPVVDILANGAKVDALSPLANGEEKMADLPAATYSAAVAATGTTTPVAPTPADVPVKAGTTTIVYAWGNLGATPSTFAVATQDVQQMPAGVPAGEAGLADNGMFPAWALGLMAAGALGAVVATRRLAADRG